MLSANFSADNVEDAAPGGGASHAGYAHQRRPVFRQCGRDGDERSRVHIQQRPCLAPGRVFDWGLSGSYFDTSSTRTCGSRARWASIKDLLFAPADRAIIEDFQPSTRLQGTASTGSAGCGSAAACVTSAATRSGTLWD